MEELHYAHSGLLLRQRKLPALPTYVGPGLILRVRVVGVDRLPDRGKSGRRPALSMGASLPRPEPVCGDLL